MEPQVRNGSSPDARGYVGGAGKPMMPPAVALAFPTKGDFPLRATKLVATRIGRREVAVTNPDKVFFPKLGLTKGDLVCYYGDVAECILPRVRRRPMQMLRYPNGVDGDFFYQKRVPESASGLARHGSHRLSGERAHRRLPGRGRGGRPRFPCHDVRPNRMCWRPDGGHVPAAGATRAALQRARLRSPGTVGSPFFGRGRTWSIVHSCGSLSGRKRRKRALWRNRAFCHLS
jgi:hypothetical protein